MIVNNKPENQHDFRTEARKSKDTISFKMTNNKIIIFSDSIAKSMKMKEFNKSVENKNGRTKLKAFPGATANQLCHYTLPTLTEMKPETAVIHVGKNNIAYKGKERNCLEIAKRNSKCWSTM